MSQLFKAILVDDEPAARRLMKSLLEKHKDTIDVIDEAGSGEEALQKIEALKPDLAFLDIQMQDLTGFEVLDRLKHKPTIIFTTAYEQYAIKAFETFSIDYLLKPIREERLEQAIEKLKHFGKTGNSLDISGLQEMMRQFQSPKKATALSIKTGDRIILVRFDTICYLEAQDKYVFIFTIDGQRYLTDQSLTSLVEKLPDQFYRIQKSYIINKDKIKEMHKHFNGRFLFVMDDKSATRLTSGRTYYDEVKNEFGL